MAKQRGLHQIKGKVGEYSYYSQTGVSGGLIRKINEGLSSRVKNDAAYANTRLNNQEFGAAADTASLLGKSVTPKFRPMILPFSQSKMAKLVLELAREHTESWGQRVVTSADTQRLCDILSSMSKRDATEFVTCEIMRPSSGTASPSVNYSAEQATLMNSLGINSITVNCAQYDIATGQWVPLASIMSSGYILKKDSVNVLDAAEVIAGTGDGTSEDMAVGTFVPEANHAGHQIVVFVIMPERVINGVSHILQEYCSFVAMPLPAAA